MPINNLKNYTYGTKGWFVEVAKRIDEFKNAGIKEQFTPTSYTEEPLTPRDCALLSNAAFMLKNRYQRIKLKAKSEKLKVNTPQNF